MARYFKIAVVVIGLCSLCMAYGQTKPGNPTPGYPHDTIMVHVQKADSGPKVCDGGHSIFIRHFDGMIPPTIVKITMIDWVQVDNDVDGLADEDPKDGVDNDLDGSIDEDGLEPGAETTALDCDSFGDGEVTLRIRDTHPEAGWISTQEWFMRMVGKPEQNFAFTSYANQTVSCSFLPGADGLLGTEDDIAECVAGDESTWVELASFNLASLGCVKQVSLKEKNSNTGGGKTPFCNITEGFMVDVLTDTNGDGDVDQDDSLLTDQFVFSISCLDNPLTEGLDESLYCPLSRIIWDIDESETTLKATAQIFVGHTGAAQVKSGKVLKP